MASRSLLLVFRRAPYGSGLARAGYDIALAAAAFEQPVELLFMDDGVWQLLPGQQPADIDARNVAATLDSLPLYDIDRFHVETRSLSARGLALADLRDGAVPVASSELGSFMESFDQVMSF
jgi:tRNA 2-thiouridine synthesizing protein C